MTKYRIIKAKGYNSLYKVQRRFLFVFWIDETLLTELDFCEWKFKDLINIDKIKKDNPRNIVVKEY